jgi:hypothetical protein
MKKGSWLIGLVLLWGSICAASDAIPTAIFSIESLGNGQYQFVDESTGDPTSWEWNFGDGNFSDEQHPLHTYLLDGIYLVCLTVSNDDGEDEICQALSVSAPPVAQFSYESIGLGGFAFTDESLNEPTDWEWDFGDGTTNPSQNPIRIYTSPGDYNVCLIATNDIGADTTCEVVNVVITDVESPLRHPAPSLYPNPATDFLTIDWPSPEKDHYLAIYRLDGILLHLHTPQQGGFLSIERWPAGSYWYTFFEASGGRVSGGLLQVQR